MDNDERTNAQRVDRLHGGHGREALLVGTRVRVLAREERAPRPSWRRDGARTFGLYNDAGPLLRAFRPIVSFVLFPYSPSSRTPDSTISVSGFFIPPQAYSSTRAETSHSPVEWATRKAAQKEGERIWTAVSTESVGPPSGARIRVRGDQALRALQLGSGANPRGRLSLKDVGQK